MTDYKIAVKKNSRSPKSWSVEIWEGRGTASNDFEPQLLMENYGEYLTADAAERDAKRWCDWQLQNYETYYTPEKKND